MHVLIVSKALVVGTYQRKLEEMAALPDIELTVAVPPFWREKNTELRLERSFCRGYALVVTPMRFNGHYHIHYYPQLGALLDRVRPDVLHFDEEPYNVSTWLAVRQAARRGIPTVFYTWQNIFQRLPAPFRWLEADVLRRSALGIAGNQDAARNLRTKGFEGPIRVIPQFGIDPELFAPRLEASPDAARPVSRDGRGPAPGGHPTGGDPARRAGSAALSPPGDSRYPFTVGFVGRLVPQKGLSVLLEAVAELDGDWRLEVVGAGPSREESELQARRLGVADRVRFHGQLPSTAMPSVLRGFDVLAAPSLTTRRWKEQFGRMLVEAMASEVAVVGSDSGEIPQVIGEAGLVVPEGDVAALRSALRRLRDDGGLRRALAQAGRERVLAHYTQAAVAMHTAEAYRAVCGGADYAPLDPAPSAVGADTC